MDCESSREFARGKNSATFVLNFEQIRSMLSARRFPPPWMIEEHNNACFVVNDSAGQKLSPTQNLGCLPAAIPTTCHGPRRCLIAKTKCPDMAKGTSGSIVTFSKANGPGQLSR
jgi:hypothetical protein